MKIGIEMDNIYWFVGWVVFWGGSLFLTACLLYWLLPKIYKPLLKQFQKTWLWSYLDWWLVERKRRNGYGAWNGHYIWHYRQKLLNPNYKHKCKYRMFDTLYKILYQHEKARKQYFYTDAEYRCVYPNKVYR